MLNNFVKEKSNFFGYIQKIGSMIFLQFVEKIWIADKKNIVVPFIRIKVRFQTGLRQTGSFLLNLFYKMVI